MALCVWLPLNKGNITNQGLSSATITGTPSYKSDGKIGPYALNGGTIQIKVPEIEDTKICTFSFWAYITSSLITSNWTRVARFNDKGTNAGSNMRFEVCPSSYNNGIYCFSNHNNANYGLTTGCITSPTGGYYDQWVHFCFTSDGTVFTRYMNGVKIGTCNYTGEAVLSGDFFLENNDKCFKQDVRVYDHCLSPKEVKEISKGLVAHYKLEGAGANPNLALNTLTTSPSGFYDYTGKASASRITDDDVFTSVYKIDFPEDTATYSNYNLYTTVPRDSSAATQDGKTYTLSFKIKASKPLSNYKLFYEYNNKTIETDIDTNWKKIILTGVANNQYSALYLCHTQTNRLKINGGSLYIAEIKLELGDTATDWIPNTADAAYIALGYDNMIARDVSGNGYNGSVSGTLSYNVDSPRYSGSTLFDGGANYIAIGRPMPTDELTVNVWAYMDNWANYNARLASCTEGGGWNFEPMSGALNFAVGVGATSNAYMTNFTSSQTPLSGITSGWHMFTGTFDGINKKLYIDGVLKASVNTLQNGTTLTEKTPLFYNKTNSIFIGAEATSSATAGSSPYFTGSMSDFRIYATALTADDILTLYKTSGIIDNKGNVYAYEFKEE